MRNLLFAVIILCCSSLRLVAANNIYKFQAGSATYADLVGDSNITSAVFAIDGVWLEDMTGKMFNLFGEQLLMDTAATYIGVAKEGRIVLGVDSAFALMDGLYSDSLELIDNTSRISYKLEGSGASEVLKIQWKNIKIASGPAGNFVNFQIWVYCNGIIEFHYGARSTSNASGYTDPVTGIYIGLWYSLNDFSQLYEKMQVTGTPPNIVIDSAVNTSVPNIQGVPEDGVVYRFTPKSMPVAINHTQGGLLQCRVVPNPASDAVSVQFPAALKSGKVQLADATGRIVYEQEFINRDIVNIPLLAVAPGTYYLHAASGGRLYNTTVVVAR